ncbi:MAG: Asp-tRNA(Asn)/Glu-tRNA(Gln) amidotransferase subunit GatC [Deltaproteobacteria bacterium]|nr:Asp-tRNA(Asn)/Glu-tRNA(Gln) amidotransferase subunit GatC [Deltaproteobacteria bacterium]
MKITREEVKNVAALARLEFTPEEEELLTEQLDQILQYMDQLNRLDTANVEPLAHVIDIVNAFRDDVIKHEPCPDLLLKNAPEREGNFLRVPKIIE